MTQIFGEPERFYGRHNLEVCTWSSVLASRKREVPTRFAARRRNVRADPDPTSTRKNGWHVASGVALDQPFMGELPMPGPVPPEAAALLQEILTPLGCTITGPPPFAG